MEPILNREYLETLAADEAAWERMVSTPGEITRAGSEGPPLIYGGHHMKRSEAIDMLAASLALAQGQMEGALKASANPFYKSKYADLASVWTACRAALSANGLSVVQSPRCQSVADVPEVVVTTLLMHISGQWIEDDLSMWPKDNTPQSIGSCISYARRYALAAMVGVYQADDDAETAQGRGSHTEEPDPGQQIVNQYFDDLVQAIKANDVNLARNRWNELNALGTTNQVWRLLNTKQKASLREILQVTQALAQQEKPAEPSTGIAGKPDEGEIPYEPAKKE
jgi:hypothetical protein